MSYHYSSICSDPWVHWMTQQTNDLIKQLKDSSCAATPGPGCSATPGQGRVAGPGRAAGNTLVLTDSCVFFRDLITIWFIVVNHTLIRFYLYPTHTTDK